MANKIKVGDLAKELKVTSKEILKALKELKSTAKTAASAIDDETAAAVKKILSPKKEVPKKEDKKASAVKVEKAPAPKKEEKKEPPKKEEKKETPKEVIIPKAEPVKLPVIPVPQHPTPPPPPVPTPIPVPVVPAPVPAVPIPAVPVAPKLDIVILESDDISVKDLADKINVKPSDLIKELMKKGMMVTINQHIAAEVAKEIGLGLNKDIQLKSDEERPTERKINIEKRALRPPVVTVMGHVDHGKTKLLDAIRKTKVAESEAGGITQHIGAYQVNVDGRKVTFLDTPGHEAFTALRARGAKATDIVVLVVAADDGVKPQTVEAANHAKAAGVPIIVAINKIDKPDANLDRVKTQLADLGLVSEDWGGQVVMVPVSAKMQTGISELLEMILLTADLQELKADPMANPHGIVIEARLDKGRGPVATVLIQNGTLKIGDVFVCGKTYGKVRAIINYSGARLEKAGPSTPIEILGFYEVPASGDILEGMPTEKDARLNAEARMELENKAKKGKVLSLEDYSKHVKEGDSVDLNLVIKADVQGSIDAIIQSLVDLKIGAIGTRVIHSGAGSINESDIMLAKASGAIVVGFNADFEGSAENLSVNEGVEVRKYNIIYKLIDDVKLAMEGLLEPEYEEVVIGHAEVRQLYKFSKVGAIAGSFVTDGKMVRGSGMRIFRGKEKIHEGKMESLKRFKEDVKTVEQNYECGISIQGYENFKIGDIIECFEVREKPRKK
ncbi:MAG: translation initiation factor IF-2 [Candidatus Margulisiibacteriota bacterium]